MSNGILAAQAHGEARDAEEPPPSAVRRPLAVAVLAGTLTTSAGLIPGRPGVDVAVALNFVAVATVLVMVLGRAPASAHPTGWRWFGASVGVSAGGAALAAVAMPWGQTALGSIPGQLLVVGAILRMLDPASLRAARARVTTLLTLFVIADMLIVHSIYRITLGGRGVLSPSETIALFALLGSIALGTGLSLVLIAVSGPHQRPVGWLLFGGQVATSLASAFSSVAVGPGLVQYLACGSSVLGLGLLPIACRLDRPCPPGQQAADPPAASVGALLPHCTGALGGFLLLLTVPLTGRLTLFGMSLGIAGLGALLACQTVSWRTQQQLTAELRRSEAYFRTLVRGSADPIVILDEELRVRWVSPAITDLLGLDPASTVGLPLIDAVHPDDAAALLAALAATETDADGKTCTARIRHVDRRYRLIQARIRDLRSDPDVGAIVLYCRDVTPARRQPAAGSDLSTFSTIDPGSGLPNRSALTHRLAAILRDPAESPTSLVVLGVDGLPEGDSGEVLRELTGRFSRVLRADDWLARAAIREFAVLIHGSTAEAEVVAARLVAAVEPLPTGSGIIRLTAAAGVSPLGPDLDGGEALRRGDLALRSARAAGPGRVRRHSDALRITRHREEALRADLDRALDDDQLHLVYQPIVDLALHRTVSVEALLRWQHPIYGEVSPAEFVPLAEESALITELGRWVLHQATATVAALPYADLCVAVNVSARHVRSGELLPDVLAALGSSGLASTRLVLEITESVLLADEHVTEDLAALRRMGVRIAVDDFGTGWSSLAYLVGLPIDVLKMDRQFLTDVENDPQRRALCSSVLHLGTSLGLSVVVEGVETQAELQLLRDMGHRYLQGYLLARPMAAEALARRLPADDGGTAPEPTPEPAVAPPSGGAA